MGSTARLKHSMTSLCMPMTLLTTSGGLEVSIQVVTMLNGAEQSGLHTNSTFRLMPSGPAV